nr:la protein 1 [Tanacetum cinerariifolium]
LLMMAGVDSLIFTRKKVGRTMELWKPEDVIEQLDNITVVASSIECDTTPEEVETFFNQFAK